MNRNTLRATDKSAPIVLFGNINPKSVTGNENVLCNRKSDIAVAIYGKKQFSLTDWQKLTGSQTRSVNDCSQDKRKL